jgi:hypothetical protein
MTAVFTGAWSVSLGRTCEADEIAGKLSLRPDARAPKSFKRRSFYAPGEENPASEQRVGHANIGFFSISNNQRSSQWSMRVT